MSGLHRSRRAAGAVTRTGSPHVSSEAPISGPGPHDSVERLTWTEILLLVLALVIAAVAVCNDPAYAFERPTRDGVDDLPVWSLQRCPPEGCHVLPLIEDGRQILVDRAECAEIRDAAAQQLPGERLVCRPEPEAVSRILGLQVIQ